MARASIRGNPLLLCRGEALSSLCELSGSFVVCTATEGAETGTRLTYGRSGKLAEEAPAARTQGTTVTVTDLFSPLPVRRREFLKASKKQYTKALQVVSAYAVMCCGVRFAVRHAPKAGGKWNNVITTAGNSRMRDAVSSVFGPKFLKGLEPVSIDLATPPVLPSAAGGEVEAEHGTGEAAAGSSGVSSMDVSAFLGPGESPAVSSATPPSTASGVGHGSSQDADAAGDSQGVDSALNTSIASSAPPDTPPDAPALAGHIHGFVSKSGTGIGRSNNERQFLFVNGRPVDMGRITRAVNEVWRVYEMKHKPAFVLNLQLPARTFDVNVAPDKRDVIFTEQGALLDALKGGLHAIWAPSRGRFAVGAANGALGAKAGQGSIPTIQELLAQRAEKRAAAAAATAAAAPPSDGPSSHPDAAAAGASPSAARAAEGLEGGVIASSPALVGGGPAVATHASASSPGTSQQQGHEGEASPTLSSASPPSRHSVGSTADSPAPAAPVAGGWVITSIIGDGGETSTGNTDSKHITQTESAPATGGDAEIDGAEHNPVLPAPAAPVRVIASTAGRSRRRPAPQASAVHIETDAHSQGAAVEPQPEIDSRRVPSTPPLQAAVSSTVVEAGTPSSAQNTPPPASRRGRVTILDDDSSQDTDLEGTTPASHAVSPPVDTAVDSHAAVTPVHKSPAVAAASAAALTPGNVPRMPRIPPRQKRSREGAPISPACGATAAASPRTPALTGSDPPRAADTSGMSHGDHTLHSSASPSQSAAAASAASTPRAGSVGDVQLQSSTKKRRRSSQPAVQVESFDWSFLEASTEAGGVGGGQGGVWNGDEVLLTAMPQQDTADTSSAADAQVAQVVNVFDADTDDEGEGVEGGSERQPAAVGADADAALSRVLTKDKFRSMHVVGQFNLGFIVAASGSDLFILDQHACDEKVRYEKYCAGLELQQQPLIIPAPLDMTAGEELVVLEHMEVFRANGFKFAVDEDAVPGRRVRLSAIPFSKRRQFGVEDVKELASMLAADPYMARRGDVRLPKIKYMLASRACRTAIMIGDPLKRDAMRRVVHGMAVLDQPWNCPHGRPTLRHLVDMAHVEGLQPVPPVQVVSSSGGAAQG